jgi:hypothetical protein
MKYGLAAVLLVYLPYLGFVIGGATVSLFLNFFGREQGKADSMRLSRELIGTIPFGPVFLPMAALIPFPVIALFVRGLIREPDPLHWIHWTIIFASLLAGCVLLPLFRSSALRQQAAPGVGCRAGTAGLLAVLFASYMLFVLLGTLLNPAKLPLILKYPVFILSWSSLAAFLLFLALSFGLTGGIALFFLYPPAAGEEGNDGVYQEYIRSTGSALAIGGSLAAPPIVVLGLLSLPPTALSLEVFAASGVAVILAAAVALSIALFPQKAAGRTGFGVPAMYIVMFLAAVLGGQTAMSNAYFGWPAPARPATAAKIGRAACRERVS